MKKYLSIVLMAAMVMVLFVSCTKSSSTLTNESFEEAGKKYFSEDTYTEDVMGSDEEEIGMVESVKFMDADYLVGLITFKNKDAAKAFFVLNKENLYSIRDTHEDPEQIEVEDTAGKFSLKDMDFLYSMVIDGDKVIMCTATSEKAVTDTNDFFATLGY